MELAAVGGLVGAPTVHDLAHLLLEEQQEVVRVGHPTARRGPGTRSRPIMPTSARYRTAPEIAAGLASSCVASSAAVRRPESVASSAENTRAGMAGIPASTSPAAKRSTNRRTACSSRCGTDSSVIATPLLARQKSVAAVVAGPATRQPFG